MNFLYGSDILGKKTNNIVDLPDAFGDMSDCESVEEKNIQEEDLQWIKKRIIKDNFEQKKK